MIIPWPPMAVTSAVWWLSAGLGGMLGLLYSVASLVVNRYAVRQEGRRFLLVYVSGMLARLAVALGLVTVILLALPVQRGVFVGFFLAAFVVGLVWEVRIVHRRLMVENDRDA